MAHPESIGRSRSVITAPGARALSLLLAAGISMVPSPVYARDGDEPASPERVWTGAALFAVVTALVLWIALTARLPARRRLLLPRRRRRLRRR